RCRAGSRGTPDRARLAAGAARRRPDRGVGRGAGAGPPGVRSGVSAGASLTVCRDGARQRMRCTHAWPGLLRPTGDAQVHRVDVEGVPLLAHTTLLDGAHESLCGPAGTAGARAVGTLLVVGDADGPDGSGERSGLRWAWSALDGPGRVLLAVGDPGPVTALLT